MKFSLPRLDRLLRIADGKRFAIISIILVLAIAATGVTVAAATGKLEVWVAKINGDCIHEWADATCSTPKTCTLCGEKQGTTINHELVDADCDTPKYCSVCSQTWGDPLGHKWKETRYELPADPTADDVEKDLATCKYLVCTRCQTVDEENIVAHDWAAATCSTPKTCNLCKDTVGEALNHEIDGISYIVRSDVAPTCTANGRKYYACELCREVFEDQIISALGHDLDSNGDGVVDENDLIVGYPATCGETGLKNHYKCVRVLVDANGTESECGKLLTSYGQDGVEFNPVVNKLDHKYGSWIVETPASCETKGSQYRICSCVTLSLFADQDHTTAIAKSYDLFFGGEDGRLTYMIYGGVEYTLTKLGYGIPGVYTASDEDAFVTFDVIVGTSDVTFKHPSDYSVTVYYAANECGSKVTSAIPALGHQYRQGLTVMHYNGVEYALTITDTSPTSPDLAGNEPGFYKAADDTWVVVTRVNDTYGQLEVYVSNGDLISAWYTYVNGVITLYSDELTQNEISSDLLSFEIGSIIRCVDEAACNRSGCSQTEVKKVGHSYTEATCTEPACCVRCGELKEGGEAFGHDYTEATCNAASYCTTCGVLDPDGEKASHTLTRRTDVLGVYQYICTGCSVSFKPISERVILDGSSNDNMSPVTNSDRGYETQTGTHYPVIAQDKNGNKYYELIRVRDAIENPDSPGSLMAPQIQLWIPGNRAGFSGFTSANSAVGFLSFRMNAYMHDALSIRLVEGDGWTATGTIMDNIFTIAAVSEENELDDEGEIISTKNVIRVLGWDDIRLLDEKVVTNDASVEDMYTGWFDVYIGIVLDPETDQIFLHYYVNGEYKGSASRELTTANNGIRCFYISGNSLPMGSGMMIDDIDFGYTVAGVWSFDGAHDHVWADTAAVEPTCTAGGYTIQSCTVCAGTRKAKFVAALGHSGGTATCTELAKCTRVVDENGTVCDTSYGAYKAHTEDVAATCLTKAVCKVCEQEYGSPLGHDGGVATCTEAGSCTRVVGIGDDDKPILCGVKYIDPLGHINEEAETCGNAPDAVCTREGCGATFKKGGDCYGGTANCTEKAVCRICAQEYGGYNSNLHTGGTATCTEKKKCTRCNEEYGDFNVYNHTGGTATCTQKAVCERCNEEYGRMLAHQTTNAPTCTEKGVCSVCGEYGEPLGHEGGKATCTQAAVCTRVLDTATGATCGEEYIKAYGHAGGTATCNELAVCTNVIDTDSDGNPILCGESYGDYNSDNHKGGTAYCEEKAVCDLCGESYGDLNSANHKGGTAYCEEKAVCDLCGESYGDYNSDNHKGGTATCTVQAVCEICETSYGEPLGHVGGEANCKELAKCTRVVDAATGATCDTEYGDLGSHTPTKPTCQTGSSCEVCQQALSTNHNVVAVYSGSTLSYRCAFCNTSYTMAGGFFLDGTSHTGIAGAGDNSKNYSVDSSSTDAKPAIVDGHYELINLTGNNSQMQAWIPGSRYQGFSDFNAQKNAVGFLSFDISTYIDGKSNNADNTINVRLVDGYTTGWKEDAALAGNILTIEHVSASNTIKISGWPGTLLTVSYDSSAAVADRFSDWINIVIGIQLDPNTDQVTLYYYVNGVFKDAYSKALTTTDNRITCAYISGYSTSAGSGIKLDNIGFGYTTVSGDDVVGGQWKFDNCAHQGAKEVETAATCVKNGYTTVTCSTCKRVFIKDVVKATGEHKDITEATCTSPSKCGVCSSEMSPALGHEGGTATCEQLAKCTRIVNGAICNTEYGELLPHTVETKATCTAQAVCGICKNGYGEPLGHVGGVATCVTQANCSRCGEYYGEVGTNHVGAAPTTCQSVISCVICGEQFGKSLPCEPITATCATTEVQLCKWCGETEFQPTAHDIAVSYDAVGSVLSYSCTFCDRGYEFDKNYYFDGSDTTFSNFKMLDESSVYNGSAAGVINSEGQYEFIHDNNSTSGKAWVWMPGDSVTVNSKIDGLSNENKAIGIVSFSVNAYTTSGLSLYLIDTGLRSSNFWSNGCMQNLFVIDAPNGNSVTVRGLGGNLLTKTTSDKWTGWMDVMIGIDLTVEGKITLYYYIDGVYYGSATTAMTITSGKINGISFLGTSTASGSGYKLDNVGMGYVSNSEWSFTEVIAESEK